MKETTSHGVNLTFAAKGSSRPEIQRKVSEVVLPVIKKAAAAAGVSLTLPLESSPILPGALLIAGEGEPDQDEDGRFLFETTVFFRTKEQEWRNASQWLLFALENISHPDVGMVSVSRYTGWHDPE